MASRASPRAWSPAELAVLERHAEERDWLAQAMDELPSRSVGSLRSMMQKVRLDLGISDMARCVEKSWMVDAINGSARLLERTLAAGRWS